MESEGSIAFIRGWKRKSTRQIAFCKLPELFEHITNKHLSPFSSFPTNPCSKAAQARTIPSQKQQRRCRLVTSPIHPTVDQEEGIYGPSPSLTISAMLSLSPLDLFRYPIAAASKGVTAPHVMPHTLGSLQSVSAVAQHSQTPSWHSLPMDVQIS